MPGRRLVVESLPSMPGIAGVRFLRHDTAMIGPDDRDAAIDAAAAAAAHERYMRIALGQAREAAGDGEVPVGAVIVRDGHLVAKARNQVETLKDPTAHAEILAITQAASAVGDWRLADCTLYVTKEPCVMCAGAIILARLPMIVWGMTDPLRGGAISLFQVLQQADLNHRCAHVAGILEPECREVMQSFFRTLRAGPAKP